MEKAITVKALKRLISESSSEFKPVLGPNVEKDNKSNNGKAYDDAKKRAKDYDGSLGKNVGGQRAKFEKIDANKTTLDYTPENVTDEYKNRVKAQVKGYTSEAEMNNKIEKAADFSDNENIYNGIKNSGKEIHDNEKAMAKSGLQAREWPDKVFDREEMYESKEGFDMKQMINRMRILQENFDGTLDDFYKEEDENGNYGEPGMVKSYDIGAIYVSNTEHEAEEENMSVEDFLKLWWNEISSEYIPFTWQKLGDGYGYHGTEIARIGNVIFKDIYGQLMVDESAPDEIEKISPSPKAFSSMLNKIEYRLDNGIKIDRDAINWADGYRSQMPEDLIDRWDDLRAQIMNSNLLRENKGIKTIFFKKTEFLTEGHMLSRIPDEFKTEGERFKMKDKTGNEYLVEWKNNKGVIISHSNKKGMNESLNRMKELYSYTSKDTNTTLKSRMCEDDNFNSTLNNTRKIIK